jgi:hypothetical protein
MKHEELIAISEKTNENVVGLCSWCLRWLPQSKIYHSNYLGTVICNNCYTNFYHMIRNPNIARYLNRITARHIAKNEKI